MTTNVNSPKAVYAQPKLAVYGAFSQLTAAGSQGGEENAQMAGLAFMA
jgi:hypothetical protein